jgi:putative hydrolase of the HAD superfamily
MPGKYKHLFFDLDRTLYDFDKNNRQTMLDLFIRHDLKKFGIDCFDSFYSKYLSFNLTLWEQYKNKQITKEYLNLARFRQTLHYYNVTNGLCEKFASEYITLSPLQTNLIPGTIELLEWLLPNYQLHIITNGFEEIQYQKIKRCKLEKYFCKIITSERAGVLKPNGEIFILALESAGAKPEESLIIGDDINADILGGKQAGIDQVWFSDSMQTPDIEPTYKISSLEGLKDILLNCRANRQ